MLYYEWCMWLSIAPGILGLFLRKIFWPPLFGSCGKGVVFGKDVILRHPKRIYLGRNVVVSEGCILDGRNTESEQVIVLGDDVILSNNVMISCKNGFVNIGPRSGLNAQTIVHSTNHVTVSIGADVIIGPCCYIVAGGNYETGRHDIPIWRQGLRKSHGVIIEEDVWLGSNVTILDGVRFGRGSIAAAGSVVTKSIPQMSICRGVPATIYKMRDDHKA